MMIKMKKIICMLIVVALAVTLLAGCSENASAPSKPKSSYATNITVYMPVGYVDPNVLADFEKEFNVGVTLEEFDSNEDMYADVAKSSKYDVLVPSDYMIDRLIQEGHLAKLNHYKLSNMGYVAERYLGPDYDQANDYHVPYMVGTLGILYNGKKLQISSWRDMFATQGILMVDSERDVVGIALRMLGYSMNSVSDNELSEAKKVLQSARGNIRGYYETTDIVDSIAAHEAFIGVVYSGDGKLAVDLNPNLVYIIPEEGSNKWTDAFVIPANSSNIDLAHEFINFMCRPNIAIRNMTYIGYTSPIKDAWDEFAGNKIMFPEREDLDRCETFVHSNQIVDKHSQVWKDIRK